jgi:mono/diheme cytochrome c family protein
MNYPVWELQSSGLIIAIVSVLHVFVSHFAVGGGLFLVLTEHKARREHDTLLLRYVKQHSRFFILLTLVFGAISGVGIWFSISLVHPAATSSLITTFVWGWAIEWTFFIAEIAAAMVYYYGWDRLTPRQHLAVGWIYFVNAYLSLVVINGILSYMLTPGQWLVTHRFWDGFFNPTYWPSLVARSFGAFGLAGLYALLTASFLRDGRLKAKVAAYAVTRWIVPMAVVLPLSFFWYFAAAQLAGVPLAEIFNAKTGSFFDILAATFSQTAAQAGQPFSQRALKVAVTAMILSLAITLYVLLLRRERFGRPSAALLMVCGLLSIGGAEWVREGLRKPYVIGGFMFVNGVRVPGPADESLKPPAEAGDDPFSIDALNRTGVLAANRFVRLPEGYVPGQPISAKTPDEAIELQAKAGAEIFRIECASCHSLDRYNPIRPLVAGKSSASLYNMIERLAEPPLRPASAADWPGAGLLVKSWRGRRMPPFVGTDAEAHALSVYLARLGAGEISQPEPAGKAAEAKTGAALFDENCSVCHDPDGAMRIQAKLKGRTADQLFEALEHLPRLNNAMPPFDGTDEERRVLADYLAGLEKEQ